MTRRNRRVADDNVIIFIILFFLVLTYFTQHFNIAVYFYIKLYGIPY
jgi:hypothetical protein